MVAGSRDVREIGTDIGARRRGRAAAVAAAVIAATAVWVVARTVFDQDLVVEQPEREAVRVGISQVLLFSLVSSLAGWGLLAVLERFAAARARPVWTVAALVILLISFMPITQVGATGATKTALVLMHLVVGAALIPGLWRTARR